MRGEYFPASYFPRGYFVPDYFDLGGSEAAPIPPHVFPVELATWLNANLGIPVARGKIPQRFAFESTGPRSSILVYAIVSTQTPAILSGHAGASYWRVQFDAYALSATVADTAAERLRNAIQDYRGPMGLAWVKSVDLLPRMSGFDAPDDGSDAGTHRSMSEYRFCVRELGPVRA